MRKRAIFLSAILVIAIVLPLIIFNAHATLSAGPNQQVYTGTTVNLIGTTTDDTALIANVTWDFGDGTPALFGTAPTLLSTTHLYPGTGVYTATLTVGFGGTLNKIETATTQITIVVNEPPVAEAGPDQNVEQTSVNGAEANLNGAASSDQYNDPITYSWTWTGGSATGVTATALFPPGTTTVTLTVSDGVSTATDTVDIVVADTTPPFVDAGEDVTVEAGTPVTLNGIATDAVSTQFSFTWSEGSTILKTETGVATTSLVYETKFNVGTHELTLSATDDAGNKGTATVTVTVVDTTPPTLTAAVVPDKLWPPNHKYAEVKTNAKAEDQGDPAPTIAFISMSSSEAENAKGTGNTTNDIVKIDDFTFNMRAERAGPGSGRIYTITYRATDASGNTAIASVTVAVPHN